MTRPRAKGTSLIEALLAVLVMGIGMLAVVGIQGSLRGGGDAARQRAEGSRIASLEMERLRAYGALSRSGGLPAETLAFDEISDGEQLHEGSATRYTLRRAIRPLAEAGLEVNVEVSWQERGSEATRRIEWRSALAAVDPRLSLAGFVPPDLGLAQRRERHPGVPPAARNLGQGRSLLKPLANGSTVLVLDNHSGLLSGVCTLAPGQGLQDMSAAQVEDCAGNYVGRAYLLSGHVRFAFGAQPDPGTPSDAALPVELELQLSSGLHPQAPQCFAETAASGKAIDYHCLIPARVPSRDDPLLYWSGRSQLLGLRLLPGGHRVCRYSDDYNGDGQIGNAEHPASYQRVAESLSGQNFLVIEFGSTCPAGLRPDGGARQLRNTVTAAHQP